MLSYDWFASCNNNYTSIKFVTQCCDWTSAVHENIKIMIILFTYKLETKLSYHDGVSDKFFVPYCFSINLTEYLFIFDFTSNKKSRLTSSRLSALFVYFDVSKRLSDFLCQDVNYNYLQTVQLV